MKTYFVSQTVTFQMEIQAADEESALDQVIKDYDTWTEQREVVRASNFEIEEAL